MTRITINRQTYERLKDASTTGGIGWEIGGIVGFRKDGAVTLSIKDETWVRLNKIVPADPEHALTLLLDEYFHRRRRRC
jgi:hypothetical protein